MRILLAVLAMSAVCAQDKFEVATIKPAAPNSFTGTMMGGSSGGPGSENPSQLQLRANSLESLIRQAFGVKAFQVVGPGWLNTTTFDIAATLPSGVTTRIQLEPLLRDLLTERFGLKFHKETKEATAYALTIAKGGPKLAAAERPEMEPFVGGTAARFTSRSGTMSQLAVMLEAISFRGENAVVVDRTGLDGKYDFELHYATSPDSSLPSLTTALEQDLGLRLEKSKVQVEVIVVDQINKTPTEN